MRFAALGTFFSLALSAQSISVAQVELKGDQPDVPLAQLWGAAAQNPRSAGARVNITTALLSANRLQQAEWTAREAVDLDPSSAQAHFLLGWVLTRQYRYTAETLDHLKRAASAIPEAHLGAADVLAHQGATAEARVEVEAYLNSGSTEHRKVAEAWLKLLAN